MQIYIKLYGEVFITVLDSQQLFLASCFQSILGPASSALTCSSAAGRPRDLIPFGMPVSSQNMSRAERCIRVVAVRPRNFAGADVTVA